LGVRSTTTPLYAAIACGALAAGIAYMVTKKRS
jgi:hypothetical protein